MDIMDIITQVGVVVGIVVLCYIIGIGLKAWNKFTDNWIPFMMAISGAALGVITYFVEPTLLGEIGGIMSALIKGAVSGLAATGVNQIVKQAQKPAE